MFVHQPCLQNLSFDIPTSCSFLCKEQVIELPCLLIVVREVNSKKADVLECRMFGPVFEVHRHLEDRCKAKRRPMQVGVCVCVKSTRNCIQTSISWSIFDA